MTQNINLNPINKKLKHPFIKGGNNRSYQKFYVPKHLIHHNDQVKSSYNKYNDIIQQAPNIKHLQINKQDIILRYQESIKQLQSQKQTQKRQYSQLNCKYLKLQQKYIKLLQKTKNSSFFIDEQHSQLLQMSQYFDQNSIVGKKEKLLQIKKKLANIYLLEERIKIKQVA